MFAVTTSSSDRLIRSFLVALLMCTVIPIAAVAQWENCSVRVTRIDGLLAPNVIGAGDTVVFHIQYYNNADLSDWTMSNGFKIYSRESLYSGAVGSGTASWATIPPANRPFSWRFAAPGIGPQVDTAAYFGRDNFSALVFACRGCDGLGSDTVVCGASGWASPGLPASDSVEAYTIWIVTRVQDSGKVICLDSISYPWNWAAACGPACDARCWPDWSGPHCFLLVPHNCCYKRTGNIDCSANGVVDITDLTFLIDHLYINQSTLCCPESANCDDVDGVDIGDLSALIDRLYISFASLAACP